MLLVCPILLFLFVSSFTGSTIKENKPDNYSKHLVPSFVSCDEYCFVQVMLIFKCLLRTLWNLDETINTLACAVRFSGLHFVISQRQAHTSFHRFLQTMIQRQSLNLLDTQNNVQNINLLSSNSLNH